MCGRYTLTTVANFKKRFGIFSKVPKFDKSYNISPSTYNPVIVRNSPKKILLMKWGFVPEWSKDGKFSLINIRKETILSKDYFKKKFSNSRCLIPADGFYEWKKINLEGIEEKIPYYFSLKENELFSFAGLYSEVLDAEGKPFYSYAIITCPPNEKMKGIHNRMPVILSKTDEDGWLDPQNTDEKLLSNFLVPYEGELRTHQVGREVNDPRNDSASLITEFKDKHD